ncbi:PDC sensor domain-containing protein [Halanaerobacter jeridensis]|uniref:C4-dicarboxylate-specific signal transduction histidine kinase n=1 Tax=Halanaerobacter jeridensis TaxID=706427 RepID=A0A938XSX3_9FIRM|nr:cache domain-containing protein [Halanaerobacter jeridensis]MBM7555716.1 C4-dicarboxylate-specific signal transduction histidine kinase [Halanaerobacter jeridensis]
MKQLRKLDKNDISIIIFVFLGILILNIPLMFYIREIGYQDSKETMNLKLKKLSEKIEDNIFAKVQGSVQSLSENIAIKKLLMQKSEKNSIESQTLNKVKLLMDNAKKILNANTVYLMDRSGTVIAGTTYGQSDETFVDQNYNFRPYFKKAMTGTNYIYGAVGKTSKQRGFYFSSPVRNNDNKIVGVAVIKIDLQELDSILNEFDSKVVLLSPQKIVFATNFADYLYNMFTLNS